MGDASPVMNGICHSCSSYPAGSGKQQKTEHRCAGGGCQCATCNSIPIVLYSPNGLASLINLTTRPGFATSLRMFGFGVLMLAAALYATMPFESTLVWMGMTAATIFYSIQLLRGVRVNVRG